MKTNPTARAIGFSRIFGLFDAVALGLSIMLALAATALAPMIFEIAGSSLPLVYGLATILFIPLILSHAELAQGAPGSASGYHLARLSGRAWLVFVTGWLMLAGHIAVAGLLADNIALRVMGLAKRLFNSELPELWVLTPVIALAALNELFGVGNRSLIRNRIVWFCFFTLFAIFAWALFEHTPEKAELPKQLAARNWLSSVAILCASLWGLEAITGARRQLRNSDRTLPAALIIALVVVNLTCLIGTAIVIRFPDLAAVYQLKHLIWSDSPFLFSIILVAIVLSWIGLCRILASGMRLIGAMLNDGFFPRSSGHSETKTSTFINLLILFAVVLTVTVSGIPISMIGGIAALTWLSAFLLVMTPHIRRSHKVLPADRHLRLPLHPLMPLLACVIALYLAVLLPLSVLLAGVVWLTLGAIYYWLYGSRGNVVAQRKMAVVGDRETLPERGLFRVLVAAKRRGEATTALITVGAALARAHDGELLVLHAQSAKKLWSPETARVMAQKAWHVLNEAVNAVGRTRVPIRPLIRIAPDTTVAILETAKEYHVNVILLGAPTGEDDAEDEEKSVVNQVFHRTARPVAILKGAVDQPPRRILVAAAAESNLNAGLQFSRAFACDEAVTITLLTDAPARDGDGAEPDHPNITIERKALEGSDLKRMASKEAADYDILVLGATVNPTHNQAVLDGLPVELAKGREKQPTVIVKAAEPVKIRWLRYLSRIMTELLPVLSLSDRSEVFSTMSRAARGNIDYYTLILLSSTIATLGLILNSGAVIIGAMLVAPLMNPILAIGNGIVLGNFLLMRRGLNASLNGIAIVIAVATAFVIFLPVHAPGSEILARTEPNVFDLLVALAAGAAAAYGVSRKSVSAALPGVAIAVALVPPLCVVGYGLGVARFNIAGGALLLFATNFAAIIMAGAAVFYFLGFRPSKTTSGVVARQALIYSVIGLLILTIPLGFATRNTIGKRRIHALIGEFFEQSSEEDRARLRDITVVRRNDEYRVHLTLHSLKQRATIQQRVKKLRESLEQETGATVRIEVTAVRAFEFEENGADH